MTDPFSVVDLTFTLSGLLGSYFYLQLSEWTRDALVLKSKSDLNKSAATTEQRNAMREIRLEVQKTIAWPNYIVNALVIAFVVGATLDSLVMLCRARTDPLYPYLNNLILVFLGLFIFLAGLLWWTGHNAAMSIQGEIKRLLRENKL
jgi:hypothetical protein